MPPFPTEAAPLKACRQCGSGVPPPTEKGMFVHGVGAVGFQSCPRCGARWQYLWYGKDRRTRSSRWALAGAVSVLLVGVLTAGVVAAVAITRSPDTPKNALFTRETSGDGSPVGVADGADYVTIVAPANLAAVALSNWLAGTSAATPRSEIETRVVEFERVASASNAALTKARWPARVDADVKKLVAANQAFVKQIDLARDGFGRDPVFTQKLEENAAAVRSAANLVRSDLGLPPA